jgi:hypothetical protein
VFQPTAILRKPQRKRAHLEIDPDTQQTNLLQQTFETQQATIQQLVLEVKELKNLLSK